MSEKHTPGLETAEEEARRYLKSLAEDREAARKWLRRMRRTHRRCTNCVDGVDGEPDGFGGAIGGTCRECEGSGWIRRTAIARATGEPK